MSRIRLAATAVMLSCGLMLVGGTGLASAQDGPARLTQVVPISGKSTKGNKQFRGTYTIDRFIAKGGKGARLRTDLALGKARARRTGSGTVRVTVRSAKRLKTGASVNVRVISGQATGFARARIGRRTTITLH